MRLVVSTQVTRKQFLSGVQDSGSVSFSALTERQSVDSISASLAVCAGRLIEMKTSLAIAGTFFAIVLSAPGAAAQGTSYHCWFKVPAAQGAAGSVYSSEVFATTSSAGTIAGDWYDFITKNYPDANAAHASGTCERFSAQTDQQDASLSLEEKNWTASNLKIVKVNYTPGQGAAAPAPKPAAPSASSASEQSGSASH
jgi:hypothetical protein